MSPRLPRAAIGLPNLPQSPYRPKKSSICLFCSQNPALPWKFSARERRLNWSRPRLRSCLTTDSADHPSSADRSPFSRVELQESLRELQKHAGRFVNPSRLQLALHGLQQTPGDESIRVAVLGLADGGSSLGKAKQVLRLLLADPLKTEEEWERILLTDEQDGKPLLLRVGYDTEERNTGGRLVREVYLSSPALRGHKLEILILEMDPPIEGEEESFAEAVLVPAMEIPTSNTGRYTPVTTPVHKCLIVGDGIMGAASLLRFPLNIDRRIVGTTANIPIADKDPSLPFQLIDIPKAAAALESFRQSVENALTYKKDWFASGLPELADWIGDGTGQTGAAMKEPLRALIKSLLFRTKAAIQDEETSLLNAALLDKTSPADLEALGQGLSKWAENAHVELRDQLDTAFDGDRWRKLSWWKLFWRVDDVSMIASDILSHRFLTDAEKEVVFLAGRISQARVLGRAEQDPNWAYKPAAKAPREHRLGYEPLPPRLEDLIAPRDRVLRKKSQKSWPVHIPVTREYLALDTVPALQALAQKLVLQTLTTSSFASIFAGLIYVSTISTTLSEAGAVAALGFVFSMRRMQGKWETARKFWEGEVREEGRKAVRSVESAVQQVLAVEDKPFEAEEELVKARDAVERSEAALESCK